jgi:hypothetical protein
VGLAANPSSNQDGARRLSPGALDTAEPRFPQRPKMRLDAIDKAVAVQEAAVGFEQVVDRSVTGEDLFGIAQIVQGDGGDG